jgi:hypothetical protein
MGEASKGERGAVIRDYVIIQGTLGTVFAKFYLFVLGSLGMLGFVLSIGL